MNFVSLGWNRAALQLLLVLLVIPVSSTSIAQDENNLLKVCADPFMLPFSNRKEEGYENRIAELFASKMGVKLQYEFFPQRIGFIRNTLRAESEVGPGYKCDLVINVPESFELAATTDPYYTTTYTLVIATGRGMDSVTSPEMLGQLVKEQGLKVRFGITDRGPSAFWAGRHGLMSNMVPFQAQTGDIRVSPGEMLMNQIISNNIDAAIVWGPTGGYFARQKEFKGKVRVLPLRDDPATPHQRFEFSMAMAVRFGEKEWKEQVTALINDNREEIYDILRDYGVPLLPLKKAPKQDDDD